MLNAEECKEHYYNNITSKPCKTTAQTAPITHPQNPMKINQNYMLSKMSNLWAKIENQHEQHIRKKIFSYLNRM